MAQLLQKPSISIKPQQSYHHQKLESMIHLIRTSILFLFLSSRLLAQPNEAPRPEVFGKGEIYAGIDIGSVGIKPVVVQIEKKENGKVVFRKVSTGLHPDNSIDVSKDKSEKNLSWLADRITEYVKVLQSPPYWVPIGRIYLLMSSGFMDGFKKEPALLESLQDKIRMDNPGVSFESLTEEQESEYIIRAVSMEEYLKTPDVNIIDIGGRTLKGGYVDKDGSAHSFSTKSTNAVAEEIEPTIAENGWKTKDDFGRRNILEKSAETFKNKYLSEVKTSKTENIVVFGGGMVYVYAAWKKGEAVFARYFNEIFIEGKGQGGVSTPRYKDAEVEYFADMVVRSADVEELFQKGEGANTCETYYGRRLWNDAKDNIYKDKKGEDKKQKRLIAGAAILRELTKELRRRGTKNFYFYNDMMYAHLYYHICLKEGIVKR